MKANLKLIPICYYRLHIYKKNIKEVANYGKGGLQNGSFTPMKGGGGGGNSFSHAEGGGTKCFGVVLRGSL